MLVNFSDYGQLLALVHNSIIAGAVLGVVGGLVGVFVVARDLPFAVHAVSEVSFAGASAGLLFGIGVVPGSLFGSLLAAVLIGLLGSRARSRNSIIAVLMPFGLGLGILCLSLYNGRTANKFGLLTGQIVAVDNPRLHSLLVISAIVLAGLIVIWRPLMFASVDPVVALARGVRTKTLSVAFMVVLGLATAVSVQIVGSLLVLSVLVTPALAAHRITAAPLWQAIWAVIIAVFSTVGGIMIALGTSVPISPFVTTLSFACFLAALLVGKLRRSRSSV